MSAELGTSYLKLSRGELEEKAEAAFKMLENCTLCPRHCKVNRIKGDKGFCKTADSPLIASYGPHYGEETPLVGSGGSGTIFFSNCNLGCIYCQNYSLSHMGEADEITIETLANIMVSLCNRGCSNINFVTPTHQVPMILQALIPAVDMGLNVPLVYNCGGYESLETIDILNGIIDIYMPDFKYSDNNEGNRYSLVPDYTERAKETIKLMHKQVGDLMIGENGTAKCGLLVRHLVLPDNIAGSKNVLDYIANEISLNTYVNIMDQYHPCYKAHEDIRLNRRLTKKELTTALDHAKKLGLKRLDKVDLRGLFL